MPIHFKSRVVAGFFLAGLSCSAAALEVFGIPLSTALSLPECQYRQLEKTGALVSYSRGPALCFQYIGLRPLTPTAFPLLDLIFPIGDAPTYVARQRATILVIDGLVEGIEFDTTGISVQHSALSALKAKFGEPTKFEPKVLQNRMGAKYETFDAAWSLPNLEVNFYGTMSRIDSGEVSILTSKGHDYRKRDRDSSMKNRRQL